ncbi:hypothetical protein LJB87_02215 [Alistipes sp. OttesenSCG-928-L06]|nr:hypothetical protein [Alistipes sp. OttesenSCG-928-L06]
MKKYILSTLLVLAAAAPVCAQNEVTYYKRPGGIDWRPDLTYAGVTPQALPQRYAVFVNLTQLIKRGLKIELEKEFGKPGNWLQLGLEGYYAPRYESGDNWRSGWVSPFTDDEFQRLRGYGASLAYKRVFSRNGAYFNTGLLYNYYSVDHEKMLYVPFQESGLTMYERKNAMVNNRFYQPAAFFNLGMQMNFGSHVVLDSYIGLGYMHSFYSGSINYFKGYTDFGYRGVYFSCGLRLGYLWGGKTR